MDKRNKHRKPPVASLARMIALLVALAIPPLPAVSIGLQQEIPIWPGRAPGSDWTQDEIDYTVSWPNPTSPLRTHWKMVRNVSTPTLTIYLPKRSKANGTGIVICPGGGYRFLSWESEGTELAEWLAAHGTAAFVLKYRLVSTPVAPEEFNEAIKRFFVSLDQATAGGRVLTSLKEAVADPESLTVERFAAADGRQAVKVVRQHAAEWNLLPNRIGIMGFSAGAYITVAVALEHDAESRPDFAGAIYGGEVEGHTIPTDAPPLFILVAQDDQFAARIDEKLYADWRAAGHSVELHVFAKGGHGFGMTKQNLPVDLWVDLFGRWIDWQTLVHQK
jgi:acetyl esterase/lipase